MVAGDNEPSSEELKPEGEFLDSSSLAIKGLASKASDCYFCPSLLWPSYQGSSLRSRFYLQLFASFGPLCVSTAPSTTSSPPPDSHGFSLYSFQDLLIHPPEIRSLSC